MGIFQITCQQNHRHVLHIYYQEAKVPLKMEIEHGGRLVLDRTFALKRSAQVLTLKALV
jgi:hypothetical protein